MGNVCSKEDNWLSEHPRPEGTKLNHVNEICSDGDEYCEVLTAAMEGLVLSAAGGRVTSAPMKITGSRNTQGLHTYYATSYTLIEIKLKL